MKRILLAVIAGIVAFSFVPVSVTGNIYVVTNGMGAVAMPMTQVKVYNLAEFNRALEVKKLDYLTHCSHLPAPDYMKEMELRALKDGSETISKFMEYQQKLEACSAATFISSAEYLNPTQTVLTNKNGEFRLKINRFDKVVLVADGKRMVAGGEESYTWLSRYAPSVVSLSDTLELNNDNEISSTAIVDVLL